VSIRIEVFQRYSPLWRIYLLRLERVLESSKPDLIIFPKVSLVRRIPGYRTCSDLAILERVVTTTIKKAGGSSYS
jgi:hypothetical protein